MKFLSIFFLLCLFTEQVVAGEIRVAVASNFANTLKVIAARFEQKTGHHLIISVGSTGKHYAQIKNGAPFDVFFAADTYRPELLEKQGIALAGSRFTYAQGQLVLWSPDKQLVDSEARVLESSNFRYLAVANPKLAPYGRAAQQVLQKKGLWDSLRSRMVRGENIGQTFQFVKSGNAQLGFVAASQVKSEPASLAGSLWVVPEGSYTAINQQVVLVKDNPLNNAFIAFVRSDEVLKIIHESGYKIP